MQNSSDSEIQKLRKEIEVLELRKEKEKLEKGGIANREIGGKGFLAIFLVLTLLGLVGYWYYGWVQEKKEQVKGEQAALEKLRLQEQNKNWEASDKSWGASEYERAIYDGCYENKDFFGEDVFLGETPLDEMNEDTCEILCEYLRSRWYSEFWANRCADEEKLEDCFLPTTTIEVINKKHDELALKCKEEVWTEVKGRWGF